MSEAEARKEIDARLEAAGWAVQDKQRINLTEKPGVAVREMDTDTGPADYMLFVDGAACGIIEVAEQGAILSNVEARFNKSTAGLQGDTVPAPVFKHY